MPVKRKKEPPKSNGWWGRITTKTQAIVVLFIGLCTATGLIWGGITRADGRYAKDSQVKEAFQATLAQNKYLETRVDVIELEGKREKIQMRLWDLERAFPAGKMPEGVIKQKIQLQEELKQIDEALDFYQKESLKTKAIQQRQQMPMDQAPVRSNNPYLQGK